MKRATMKLLHPYTMIADGRVIRAQSLEGENFNHKLSCTRAAAANVTRKEYKTTINSILPNKDSMFE